jgi:hypothetical protein
MRQEISVGEARAWLFGVSPPLGCRQGGGGDRPPLTSPLTPTAPPSRLCRGVWPGKAWSLQAAEGPPRPPCACHVGKLLPR